MKQISLDAIAKNVTNAVVALAASPTSGSHFNQYQDEVRSLADHQNDAGEPRSHG
jgi:hypothetical protein